MALADAADLAFAVGHRRVARGAHERGRRERRLRRRTALVDVAIGLALPATPMASLLGFTTPPASYSAFLVLATLTYLVLVEVVKRQVVRRLGL
jgi:hypothetical protein